MAILYIILLVIAMCFCIFNYWFQKEKYNRMTTEEIDRLSKFNSPAAWIVYTLISVAATLIIISYYVYNLYLAILEMQ